MPVRKPKEAPSKNAAWTNCNLDMFQPQMAFDGSVNVSMSGQGSSLAFSVFCCYFLKSKVLYNAKNLPHGFTLWHRVATVLG